MTNTTAELFRGNSTASVPTPNSQPVPPEPQRPHGANTIFKSGPLFISSKGIGWTSWKKRWFILTQTSLVFFRSDPSAIPPKGGEVNLTLGGIDLNNSGSVVVKPDKKLLTVQFPDGQDGRAFTLKAETTEDLYEWKMALEDALAQAPNAVVVPEPNVKDKEPVKSTVIGRPILLALEDVDGTPTFLEKALRFIEEHGANVEGILRQAADVDEVERRVREYEQGKVEFSSNEDAHVIGDCVKHVLRELPSSPVPASCCKALLEACRTDRSRRLSAMRTAINDTFPEPNRRLLQRILMMMQIVASHKAVNRMSSSAVAACMAPLLLRPLLAGECEIDTDFDVGGDGSVQLLQAAAAANHAQAIVITLLEEYNTIFGNGSASPGPDIYTDSEEESESGSEEATDDDLSYDDDEEYDDEEESDVDADGSEAYSGTGESEASGASNDKDHEHSSPSSKSSGVSEESKVPNPPARSLPKHEDVKSIESRTSLVNNASSKPADIVGGVSTNHVTMHDSEFPNSSASMRKSKTISNGPAPRQRTLLGRASGRKNLSMESIDFSLDDEDEIERLEDTRKELQNQIAEEVKANEKLQTHMENRKQSLQERRLALEQDVARLQEQLHKERNSQATHETKAELEELALLEVDLANLEKKASELGMRLNIHLQRKKNKPDTEVAAPSQSDRSMSKDSHGGAENAGERKPESTPLQNKHPPTGSKKSGTKGEVHRGQIANEYQNPDKCRESSHSARNQDKGKGSELYQSLPSPNRHRGFETAPNQEKARGLDGSQTPQISDRGSSKGKSHQSSDKLRKSDSHPSHHSDAWNQSQRQLERGMSDGHHQSYNVDKGR